MARLTVDTQELNNICKLLKDSIREFYDKDKNLVCRDSQPLRGMERSCAFRIGHYLCKRVESPEFQFYNVDMEYNRNGHDSKRIDDDKNGVQPDLIVHRRGENEHNLLVVEFKYGAGNDISKSDVYKLEGFTEQSGKYKYKLGIWVGLSNDFDSVDFRYFQNGERCHKFLDCAR